MSTISPTKFLPYKVKDMSLAEWGRKEIRLAEHEMRSLDGVLERLADYTENREILQSRVRNALVYPILLTVVCVIIVSLLLGYVVPEVVNVFKAGKHQLPLLTRLLIAASDGFRQWWWLIGLGLGGLYYGLRRWLQQPAPQFGRHRRYPHQPQRPMLRGQPPRPAGA